MTARSDNPATPTNSAALSLLELRRHLLRRAGALTARARGLRQKGDAATAARLAQESERLLNVAHTMGQKKEPSGS